MPESRSVFPTLVLLSSIVSLQGSAAPQAAPDPLTFPEPEIGERIAFRNDVLRALSSREYEELTRLAEELRKTKARFANGSWKLRAFYDAFSQLGHSPEWFPVAYEGADPDWDAIFERLDEWRQARPRSITPRVAHAHALNAYAWVARSREWAQNVSRDRFEVFAERLALSAAVLEEANKLEESCPGWYTASERLALGQGWDKTRFRALVDEASAYEPEYFATYELQAHYLLPRWFGETGEWQAEGARWTSALGPELGEEIYARTIWYLRDTGNWDNLFTENDVDWPLARRGLVRMRAKYRDSFEVQSISTLLSVQARDRVQARFLFAVIGNRMDRGVWRTEKQFRWSQNWASGTGTN